MKKLNVPLIRQPENSRECGIAGIATILKYYGLDFSYEKLVKEFSVDEIGVYIPSLGQYLLKNGFNFEIVTLHPKLFIKKDEGMEKTEILKRLKSFIKEAKGRDKIAAQEFLDFLMIGGEIKVKIPSLSDIKEEIDSGRPLGAVMTTFFLTADKPKFNFHFNIIVGYDEENIYTLDPSWDEKRGGEKKYKVNDFFYSLYATAYGDLDNACLIKVSRKL